MSVMVSDVARRLILTSIGLAGRLARLSTSQLDRFSPNRVVFWLILTDLSDGRVDIDQPITHGWL
jgi:hypothetical protein